MSLVFTVNELSKITHVSTRNIRYYDTIGLFSPSGFLENGYRFYTIEKIEELRLISYMRHAGVSIKDIKKHLENRNIEGYENLINNHIQTLDAEIRHLQAVQLRLKNRLKSLKHIRELPPLNEIFVETYEKQPVLKIMKRILTPLDWEQAMSEFENELPPSLMIGETGFFVDIQQKDRQPTEFVGMYMLANDPFSKDVDCLAYLDGGEFLVMYLKGDHEEASKVYDQLYDYARIHDIVLKNYALERTLIDHFITTDENLYITEIKIPISSR